MSLSKSPVDRSRGYINNKCRNEVHIRCACSDDDDTLDDEDENDDAGANSERPIHKANGNDKDRTRV